MRIITLKRYYHSVDTDDLGLDIGLGHNHSAGDHDHEDLMIKDIGLGFDHSDGDREDLAKIT